MGGIPAFLVHAVVCYCACFQSCDET